MHPLARRISPLAAAPTSGPLAAALLAASLLTACNVKYSAPPPVAKTAMPAGAALKPWVASDPTRAAPQAMALGLGTDSAYVALTNLDASYGPGGPGLLVHLAPHAGTQTLVDLGGTGGHACTNSGVVRNQGGLLLATCSGGFGADTRGRAVVQIDPNTDAVLRTVNAPDGFQPSGVAVTSKKIWVGDFAGARMFSIDRTTFALADGADAAHPAIALPCDAPYTYVSDLLAEGDLFALCAAQDGYLVRLDPDTGAVKGDKVLVGAEPQAMAAMGDGRLVVVNSVSGSLTFVTLSGAASMSAQVNAVKYGKDAALQDVKTWTHDGGTYVFTTASGTNTVQRLDVASGATDFSAAKVAEINTGDGTNPYAILPLDDHQAIVSNNVSGDVAGVDFAPAATTSTVP